MNHSEMATNGRQGRGLSWSATLIVALGCLWACFLWTKSIPIFAELFRGLNVELPLPTRILLTNYRWLLPVVFGGLAAVAIVKEFLFRDVQRCLAATVVVFVVAGISAGTVYYLLNLPVLDLVQKLNR